MKFYRISSLESMIINIKEDGQNAVWNIIEKINNPIARCNARKLFTKALNKINNNL